MPARALFDHGIQTKGSLPLSRDGTAHLSDFPLPACNRAVIPCLSAFACSTINLSQTGRQYANMPKPQKHSKKNTLILSSTTGICNHIQSTQPTLIPFFFHYQASPLAIPSAGELQIQIHLAALSGCCKLELSILTLIRPNEQHSHVLSKAPQTGGNILSSHSLAVFHRRTDAKYSTVMTTNLARHILLNLCCFCSHLHYFKVWERSFLTLRHRAYGLFPTFSPQHNYSYPWNYKIWNASGPVSCLPWNASAVLGPTNLSSSLKCRTNLLSLLKSHWLRRSTIVVCLFHLSFRLHLENSSHLHSFLPWFRGMKMGSTQGSIPFSFIILTCCLSTLCPNWNLGREIFRVRQTDRGQAVNWR